jgi:hypothetical protein
MWKLSDQQSFSVRDRKRLNKLLGQQLRNNLIDYTEIINEFPGKTLANLKRVVSQLMMKKRRNATKARIVFPDKKA